MKAVCGFLLICSVLLILDGCSNTKPTTGSSKPDFVRGGRVFDAHCAQCHLDADNDTPQLDEADDWDMRTHVWVAVLKDHVKSGFLRMPAQGGQAALSDQNIDDALYYIQVKIKAQE